MEPLRLPSEEEINTAYDRGRDAVAALFHATFTKMAERIQQLENRVTKNSSNSGKPPSSDGLSKKPKSLHPQSGKKSGGQAGHPGNTLKAVRQLDHIQIHQLKPLPPMPGGSAIHRS